MQKTMEYYKDRRQALKFIFIHQTNNIDVFTQIYSIEYLKEFEHAGFVTINEISNTYKTTQLGIDYCKEFFFN